MTSTADTSTSANPLVLIARTVSLRASGSARNQRVVKASMMFLDDLRETQQLRTQLDPRPPRRFDADRKPHLTVFDKQAGDATELDERVAVADGENRCTLERVEQLRRALRVHL